MLFKAIIIIIIIIIIIVIHDKWVSVNAWRFLRFRMEERPPVWSVAANILNNQSRTADKVWFSSLGVLRGANNSLPCKVALLRNSYNCLGTGM